MSASYDAALAVAQMLTGNLLRSHRGLQLTKDMLRAQAESALAALKASDVDVDQLVADLTVRFNVVIHNASVLLDDEEKHQAWVSSELKADWRFWRRCEQYLLTSLPEPVVRSIDEETDKILGLLGDPSRPGPWNRRGLVVGDVQFGKTSNYSALACKAADAGYKVIIVLAGIHESLRMQTQIRLDEAFLGFKTDPTRQLTGVGLYDPSLPAIAATARSQKGDFNKIVANQLSVPLDSGPPILLVVKKNARMLRNLLLWLEKISRGGSLESKHAIRSAAALIIDDESDNASIDTSEQSFDSEERPDLKHQPTAINGLIRKILDIFECRSYVGYTATPFANIFIHRDSETADAGRDLFPKHFIVNLHAPSNYFGPVRAFGSDEEGGLGAALVRIIDEKPADKAEIDRWMPLGHKQAHLPNVGNDDQFPTSLRRAILSFILSCAVRKIRGQATEHNSMLIHVTRYTAVQAQIFDQVSESLVKIRRRLRFGDAGAPISVIEELRKIWNDDFVPTTEAMKEEGVSSRGEMPGWEIIASLLPDVAAGIKVKQINGQAQDVLDYDSYKDTGIDVIVVGGDKLSRGLTLYGLTISYFTRQTDMYDTLLQMGRWFGYRNGYLDLCRLYTTGALNGAFEHIATASSELREEFDLMATIGKTPSDFGLKVRSHPALKVTAANKKRHSRDIILYASYAGIVSETKSFSLGLSSLKNNRRALDHFVADLRKNTTRQIDAPTYNTSDGTRAYANAILWPEVRFADVEKFLLEYETEPSARRANKRLWLRYINAQIAATGDLSAWNVALFGGGTKGAQYEIGGITIGSRERNEDHSIIGKTGFHTKRIVTTRDIGVDVPSGAWEWAQERSQADGSARQEPSSAALCLARQKFSLNPLLMLYLPQPPEYSLSDPIVGVALAFPTSDTARSIRVGYTVNSVYEDDVDDAA